MSQIHARFKTQFDNFSLDVDITPVAVCSPAMQRSKVVIPVQEKPLCYVA